MHFVRLNAHTRVSCDKLVCWELERGEFFGTITSTTAVTAVGMHFFYCTCEVKI